MSDLSDVLGAEYGELTWNELESACEEALDRVRVCAREAEARAVRAEQLQRETWKRAENALVGLQACERVRVRQEQALREIAEDNIEGAQPEDYILWARRALTEETGE